MIPLKLPTFILRASAVLALVVFASMLLPSTLYAAEVLVAIHEYSFNPPVIEIKVGDTVKWLNQEKRTSHSILFSAEALPESERMFPGESWQRTFTRAGVYPYRCGPHEEMKGIIRVID